MKTVPSAAHPPQVPLATTAQTVEGADGSTRLALRAKMPGTAPQNQAELAREPAQSRGRVLDQEA